MKNESGNNATIRDVSRRAGVSVSTVSRVINGSAGVRDEPRLRVQKAIEELNYKPSYSARLLKTQKSYSVFILVLEINNPYFTDIYHGTRVTMEAHGYVDKHPHDRYFALEAAARARGMPFRPQLVHCEDHPEDQFACGNHAQGLHSARNVTGWKAMTVLTFTS